MPVSQVPTLQRTNQYAGLGEMLLNIYNMYQGIKADKQAKEDKTFGQAWDVIDTTSRPSTLPPVEPPPVNPMKPWATPTNWSALGSPLEEQPANIGDILRLLGM